nr:glycine-rich cell wall structural protein 1.8-like [Oryza sativa Japonica Group]
MAAHGGGGFGGQGGGRGWGFAQGFHPGFDGGRGRGRDQRGHNGGGFGGGYGGGYGGGGYGGNSHGGYGGNRNRRGWQGGRRFAPAAGHAASQFHAGGGVPGHQAGGQAVVGQLQQQAAAGQFQLAGFQTAGLADQQPAQAPFQAPLAGQQPTQPAAAGNQTREAGAVLFQQVSQSQKAQVAAPANGGGLGTSQAGTSALLASSQAAPAAAPAGSTRGAIIGGSAQDPAATHLEGFMATKPEPAQAGKQKSKVEGMGFYYIPMNDNPKSNVEEHTVLGPMDTKTIKGKIRFEKGVENDVNRYEIDKVWVQFRGPD